jgi:hypothetical protein
LKKGKYRISALCVLHEHYSCPTENSRCSCYSFYLFCSIIAKTCCVPFYISFRGKKAGVSQGGIGSQLKKEKKGEKRRRNSGNISFSKLTN